MDKIPKLRRKPKPPAIETSVDRTSTDTSESAISSSAPGAGAPIAAESPSSRPPSRPTTSRIQSPAIGTPTTPAESSNRKQQLQQEQPSGRKSPFRNLKLRTSAKRARESSPAAPSTFPPKLPPLSHQNGVKIPKNGDFTRQAVTGGEDVTMGDDESSDPGPIMPAFLELSVKDMDAKFEEISWDERGRILKGSTTGPNSDARYATYKQVDWQEKGLMDRYQNIKPWNHNRVKLQVAEPQLDYVNASHITIKSPSDEARHPLRYIAMQGPTEPSIPYVWRMIAEQVETPAVIIQLTNNYENGTLKCGPYFPTEKAGDEDEGEAETEWILNDDDVWEDGWKATLTHESTETLSNEGIEKRQLTLKIEGEEPRTIWHFWYRRWPDFGVPSDDDLETFFDLMRLSREHSSPKGPRIVHCSAGVGRTGTFIALEHLIRELDVGALCDPAVDGDGKTLQSKPDLIFKTVQDLREQRKGMVQSEAQYRFLYEVLKKMWTKIYGPVELEDEDSGGVHLDGPVKNETDPFSEADIEDDDDEGGAIVGSGVSTPAG